MTRTFSVFGGDMIGVDAHPDWTPPGVTIKGVDGEWGARDVPALVTALQEAYAYAITRDTRSVGNESEKSVDVHLSDVLAVLDEEDAPKINALNKPYAPVGRLSALISRLTTEANQQREKAAR